jgi:membrane protease YdiL (CAAX protease family)
MSDRERQRLLALSGLALFGAACVAKAAAAHGVVFALVVASGALAAWGVWGSPGPGAGVALLAALLPALTLTRGVWQLVMVLSVLAFIGVARLRPALGEVPPKLGRVPLAETALCAAVTPLALVLWLRLAHPDLGDLLRAVPRVRVLWLVVGGALFAVVNAGLEELIWRGLIQSRLREVVGKPAAIALQAASFGLAHAAGFPRGLSGVVLAGVWAVMLGMLRERSGGLLAAFLAHVVADATIACLVISLAD